MSLVQVDIHDKLNAVEGLSRGLPETIAARSQEKRRTVYSRGTAIHACILCNTFCIEYSHAYAIEQSPTARE